MKGSSVVGMRCVHALLGRKNIPWMRWAEIIGGSAASTARPPAVYTSFLFVSIHALIVFGFWGEPLVLTRSGEYSKWNGSKEERLASFRLDTVTLVHQSLVLFWFLSFSQSFISLFDRSICFCLGEQLVPHCSSWAFSFLPFSLQPRRMLRQMH